MRTYLVTGGAGFIGSNYIHYMFKKYGDDIRIINVDVLTYAGNLEKQPVSEIIRINRKRWEIEECFRIMKSNLCLRPMFVRTAEHIRGHVLCCVLAHVKLGVMWVIPLFVLCFVATMIIPGHVLNAKAKKQC